MTKNIDRTVLKNFLIEIFKSDEDLFQEIGEELKAFSIEEGDTIGIPEEELTDLITKNFARYGEVYKALA